MGQDSRPAATSFLVGHPAGIIGPLASWPGLQPRGPQDPRPAAISFLVRGTAGVIGPLASWPGLQPRGPRDPRPAATSFLVRGHSWSHRSLSILARPAASRT